MLFPKTAIVKLLEMPCSRRLEFHRLQLQVSTPPQRLTEYDGALQNIEQTAKCRVEMASDL